MIDNLTLVAAVNWMLDRGWDIFSKKQNQDTGEWWIMIDRKGDVTEDGIPCTTRIRGDGLSLADAVEDAFAKAGIGGIAWKLRLLEQRVQMMQGHLNVVHSHIFGEQGTAK